MGRSAEAFVKRALENLNVPKELQRRVFSRDARVESRVRCLFLRP